ncbi:MAG: transglycosylase family protein [Acidimicrobiales bacterium]
MPVVDVVELTEVPPLARVRRSRLAFALAVSVAALPLLVVDNLPVTAAEEATEIVASPLLSAPTTEAPTTTTTGVPTTTEAPTTTQAPTTTVAPTTTEAPTTTAAPPTTAAPRVRAPAPPPTTAPPATTSAPRPPSGADPSDPATWDRLAQCESGGNWSLSTGTSYFGGLQFSLATWQNVGGSGYPHQASREEQIHRGQILQARAGWGQWPACADQLGYR